MADIEEFVPWAALSLVTSDALICLDWTVIEGKAGARRSSGKGDRGNSWSRVPEDERQVGDQFRRMQGRRASDPDRVLFDYVLPEGWTNETLRRSE